MWVRFHVGCFTAGLCLDPGPGPRAALQGVAPQGAATQWTAPQGAACHPKALPVFCAGLADVHSTHTESVTVPLILLTFARRYGAGTPEFTSFVNHV